MPLAGSGTQLKTRLPQTATTATVVEAEECGGVYTQGKGLSSLVSYAAAKPAPADALAEILRRHSVERWDDRLRDFERDRILDELLLRHAAGAARNSGGGGGGSSGDLLQQVAHRLFPAAAAAAAAASQAAAQTASSTTAATSSAAGKQKPPPARRDSDGDLAVAPGASQLFKQGSLRRGTVPVEAALREAAMERGASMGNIRRFSDALDSLSIREVLSMTGTDDDCDSGSEEEEDVEFKILRLDCNQCVLYPKDTLPTQDIQNATIAALTDELFKRYDADHDGRLNRQEYSRLQRHLSDNPTVLPEGMRYTKKVTRPMLKQELIQSLAKVSGVRRLLVAPPIGTIATVDGVEGYANGKRGRVCAVRRDGLVLVSLTGGSRELVDPSNLIWEEEY